MGAYGMEGKRAQETFPGDQIGDKSLTGDAHHGEDETVEDCEDQDMPELNGVGGYQDRVHKGDGQVEGLRRYHDLLPIKPIHHDSEYGSQQKSGRALAEGDQT
jgi:hypothetical protein